MKTYPLTSLSFEQAKQKQFDTVDAICQHFNGQAFLNSGDLGVVSGINQPKATQKVEAVLSTLFNVEAALLVRGSGTGALRSGLFSMISSGGTLLVHDAPIYPTTLVNIKAMGLNVIKTNFNDLQSLKKTLDENVIDLCLIQHTRQQLSDNYCLEEIINIVKSEKIKTLIDDNYAVMKVDKIGCELGGTLSTFSSFKLLGPVGVGVVVGEKQTIESIKKNNYSGGGQVQGYEALEVLRGLTFAPVLHAVQSEVNDQLVSALQSDKFPYIKNAFLANAQSKVLLIEFQENIAEQMVFNAELNGALPHPVGAESKFELPPLFYRVSGTFLKSDPTLKQRMIRINPNRAGVKTVLRILNLSYEKIKASRG